MNTAEKVSGIISSFDEITADVRDNIHDNMGESKDVQDILDLIHQLQQTANSDNPLREMLESHVADHDNPHNFTLDIGEVELFDTLYSEYISRYGNIITLTEFITAMISVKRFATHDDVDNSTNLDDAVNLDVLNYAVSNHDEDLDSHNTLIRSKFPGDPITVPPTVIAVPNLGIGNSFDVERSTGIYTYDNDGRIVQTPANEIAIDYSYGIPTIPIFGEITNEIINSEAPTVQQTGISLLPTTNLSIFTPNDNKTYHLLYEDGSTGEHKCQLNYPTPVAPGAVSTFSVHYFPLIRGHVRISLRDFSDTEIASSVFDITNEDAISEAALTSPNANVHSEILKLPNQWYRLCLTVKDPDNSVARAVIQIVDENGNVSYSGSDSTIGALWQYQSVRKANAAPPILTAASPVTIAGTKISKDITTEYNPYSGTVAIKAIMPLMELYGVPFAIGYLEDGVDPIISISSDHVNDNAFKIITKSELNGDLTEIVSDTYDPAEPILMKTVVASYTAGHQGYGFTGQYPHVFDYYNNTVNGPNVITSYETNAIMVNYFTNMAGTPPFNYTVPVFLQINNGEGPAVNSTFPLPYSPDDILPQNSLSDTCTKMYIGYDPGSSMYMDGYLVEFAYYPVFADLMNIEFLLNEYLP